MLSGRRFYDSSFLVGLAPDARRAHLVESSGATGGALAAAVAGVCRGVSARIAAGHGFWGSGIVVAPILGPVLGGWLTRDYAGAGLLHQHPGRHRVDRDDEAVHLRSAVPSRRVAASGLLGHRYGSPSGIGALQIVLDKGQQEDWFESNLIVALALISVVTLVALVCTSCDRTTRSSICACSKSGAMPSACF